MLATAWRSKDLYILSTLALQESVLYLEPFKMPLYPEYLLSDVGAEVSHDITKMDTFTYDYIIVGGAHPQDFTQLITPLMFSS